MKKALLLTISIGLILPLLLILCLSAVQHWEYPTWLGNGLTWSNWKLTLSGSNGLLSNFGLSLGLSSLVAVVATVLGFVFSRALSRHPKSRKLVSLALYPYLLAPVILAAMWQYYFVWMGLSGTVAGVMLAQLLFISPYATIFYFAFWSDRMAQLEFQASTLGAHPWQVFRKVIAPAAKNWSVICLLQCFLISWFEYGLTRLIGVGKVATLPVVTMQLVKEANPYFAAVAACLMVLPLVALLIVNQQLFTKSVEGVY